MRIDFRLAPVLAALSLSPATAHAAPSAAELEQAGNLFAITCSSSFCHGEGGVGGRGPSLRSRSNFTPEFVRTTITNGRSGTPMPSFKDALSQPELEMIVGYVMSLSPENHSADAAGAAAPAAPPAPAAAPLSAQALAGEAVFFDAAKPAGCALCHSYGEKGGPIGPDLTGIAKRTPHDIYQSIVKPTVLNPDYAVAKASAGGATVTGLLKQKTDKIVQLYDLSSVPPVLRSFYPADGAKIEAGGAAPLYTHDLSSYSKDQIAGVIAFLKSAAGPSKDVTPQDFDKP